MLMRGVVIGDSYWGLVPKQLARTGPRHGPGACVESPSVHDGPKHARQRIPFAPSGHLRGSLSLT